MSPQIIGGGPAGASAALALAHAGAPPIVYEQSAFPRHKVCGEFLSPEIRPVLEHLGVGEAFLALRPAAVGFAELHFGRRSRRFRLPEPAYGLSRYALDDWLLRAAVERGAELRRERAPASTQAILAAGRRAAAPRGARVFGFKAHFSGPANDAVELYFFSGGYCGLCPIEGGRTNVCGLVQEGALRARAFDVDALVGTIPILARRLAGLELLTRWLTAGPLRYGRARAADVLAAGDALCFADPFTGTGVLAAVQTGVWAGEAYLDGPAGRRLYLTRCASFYRRQLATGVIVRRLLDLGWAETLAGLLPGPLLFRLTRPQPAAVGYQPSASGAGGGRGWG